ncbi:hypothetical protein [Serratia rubidaea]|uniref:hypothetical protein n=1 Tax=Serratia rubidaea TaxID=61652 RepID=UPI000A74880E|nr:hypothetical protein [Serratia rubidaea]MBD8451622.1 hypothetical protein [Serratia rubidaea]MBS0971856.1 hypothetical protein [Serratia rubidaea]MCR0998631.1 hypothetical protein [Serratia rubidaea]MDC6111289.1 hypothetical protein [Serratia rubidaea]QPR62310.1 hypothetical protein I6G83_15990 [Serratia rubidaea]
MINSQRRVISAIVSLIPLRYGAVTGSVKIMHKKFASCAAATTINFDVCHPASGYSCPEARRSTAL